MRQTRLVGKHKLITQKRDEEQLGSP